MRGAGARQPDDEHRCGDGLRRDGGVLRSVPHQLESLDQYEADHRLDGGFASLIETGITLERCQQHPERLLEGHVPEVVETRLCLRRRYQGILIEPRTH